MSVLSLPCADAGTVPGRLQGPYGVNTMPSGYEGATGGYYINKDKQPQAAAAPKLGGFYQRDARDVEAQLLAQAFAARTGQPAPGQPALGQPALSQPLDASALPHESAYGRAAAPQPGNTAGAGRQASSVPGGASHQSSGRAQSPAVPGTGQQGVAGLDHAAQAPLQAGSWAAGRPVPGMPGAAGAPLGQPGQLQGSLLGPGLPQAPLWPSQPNQLAQVLGEYGMLPGGLGTSMAGSSGMAALGAAGHGLVGFPGYPSQYGASTAGRVPTCILPQTYTICG